MRITGSLWSVPAEEQARRLTGAAAAGLAVAHWDSTDGEFAVQGGFSPESARRVLDSSTPIESEAHLMLNDPRSSIPAWAEFCSQIVVPIEVELARQAVALIERLGRQPALAVSLQTSLREVPADYPILLMSIEPGQAGSAFEPAVIPRISELRERERNPLLGVDGGVGAAQFAELGRAGANWIVSGTSLFAAPDPAEWLRGCETAFAEAHARA
jgi:pentose-5-phosphate-3-epimerase